MEHRSRKYLQLDRSRVERVGSENETPPCIFVASTALLKECEDAYVPQFVSIGPYHWGKEKGKIVLYKWEAVKRVALRMLMKAGCAASTFNDEVVEVYCRMVSKFEGREDQITHCYDKHVGYKNESIGAVMVRSACFILEFFRCLFNDSVGECENLERFFPNFGSYFNPLARAEIMKDLIKLENQIPLFVLEEVLSMEMGDDLQKAKFSLQLLLKTVFHKFYYRPFAYVASGESLRQNHILDIYYYCCVGAEEIQGGKEKVEDLQEEEKKATDLWIFIENSMEDLEKRQFQRQKVPSAVQLKNGGMKIQAKGQRFQDIGFEGRTLYIPPVELNSDSEIFIRNLTALENCYPYGSLRRMTAFAQFMNDLCQTEEGSTVMRENGVIVGNLWQDSEVIRFFSSCTQSHSLARCYPIEVTRKKLLKYYGRKNRIAAAEAWNEFRKTYFSKPWFLIGGIGATIILILTAVQVFCLFHSCGAH